MNQFENTQVPKYPIRMVAKKLNLSSHTLRMYERAGLLLPYKKETRHRLYSDEDVRRVEFIMKAIREDKLNIEGVRRLMALLPCWDIKPCSQKRRDKCLAVQEYKHPCWMLGETLGPQKTRECRNCRVYYQSIENIFQLKTYMK
jgi:MerR family transcriptional regulator/heat shock protein HspR